MIQAMDHPPAVPARPRPSSDILLFFLASLIWGTTWLAIKFQRMFQKSLTGRV